MFILCINTTINVPPSHFFSRCYVYQQKHNKWTPIVRYVKSLKTKTKCQLFHAFPSIRLISGISYTYNIGWLHQYVYPVFYIYAISLLFLTNLKGEPLYLTSIWEASRFQLDLVHLFYTTASLLLHDCDSQSAPRHHPPRRSTTPLQLLLERHISRHHRRHPSPSSAAPTLTFNLENCLALVVCFHYCQLFRSLCLPVHWLTAPQSMTRGPPTVFLCFPTFRHLHKSPSSE